METKKVIKSDIIYNPFEEKRKAKQNNLCP